MGLTTGLKVSKKSKPSVCWKPLAINWALYFLRESSGLSLILITHLQPITLWSGGRDINVQVSFLMRASYSAVIAFCQSTCLTTWWKYTSSKKARSIGKSRATNKSFLFINPNLGSSHHGMSVSGIWEAVENRFW